MQLLVLYSEEHGFQGWGFPLLARAGEPRARVPAQSPNALEGARRPFIGLDLKRFVRLLCRHYHSKNLSRETYVNVQSNQSYIPRE